MGTLCYAPPPSLPAGPWCSGPTCQPVTLEIAGSNPVGSAISTLNLLAQPRAPHASEARKEVRLGQVRRHSRVAQDVALHAPELPAHLDERVLRADLRHVPLDRLPFRLDLGRHVDPRRDPFVRHERPLEERLVFGDL